MLLLVLLLVLLQVLLQVLLLTLLLQVIYTGWSAAAPTTGAGSEAAAAGSDQSREMLGGHAKTKGQCAADDPRCQSYMGYKPLCASIIRNSREAGL